MSCKRSGGAWGGRHGLDEERRQRKTKDPCAICFLRRELCICARIPKLRLQTKISLIIHARELKRTTNTGRLALAALIHSEMRVRGRGREALDLSDLLDPRYETYLFYPGAEAQPLEAMRPARPVQLLVPDGNWRQAGKVGIRHPELREVPRVRLTAINPGRHHLRREHFAEGFSTLEAIARALGILEGPEVESALLALYAAKLAATLRARGTNLEL